MSMMAMSALNPDAPMFIPAAFRRVEDYSPEWYELVKTTAWFRDHWYRQQQLYGEDDQDVEDVAALLPDDSVDLLDAQDLFYSPPSPQQQAQLDFHNYNKQAGFGGDMDAVLRTLSLNSPRGGVPSAAAPAWSPRQAEKPVQHFGARAGGGGARRAIHQPR
ncbi:protein EARLY RESPONSIVE TO DEHYDRATION 15-like [Lolium perenne]|uniref:protein EARLY RESPONSIVE TO DEHYDRATION 15-like n=1 Tax=Lolium perenne TaxID=4522 RepID=UPI0021F64ED5|nr:protein EARLY RESPONSIVE TO DEHYDRATION 15-like [Lolium perenne]XP_051213893.1 protein EARLY RESPONSIVE TO DEHYDRATION 15-like [Lolium perenne]